MISTSSLLAGFAVLYTYEIIAYRETVANQLRIQANMLAENSAAALAFNDTGEAGNLLRSLRTEPNILVAALYHTDSTLFVQMALAASDTVPNRISGLKGNINSKFKILIPVMQQDKIVGMLFISRGAQDVTHKILRYLFVVLAVLILCFGLTYLLSRRLAKSISKPIVDLANTAEIISEKHDYTVRAKTSEEGEIKTLTSAFNLMLSRIDTQSRQIQKHTEELELKVHQRTLEINRQKDFAETIINSSLVLIAVFDHETRLIGFNKRCEIEFGMRREDVLGKKFSEAMPAVVGSPAYKSVLRALNGEIAHYEQYRSSVSGEYYENFGTPLFNEKNEVYAAVLTAHNITATVTANEKLQRSNEELKKKNTDLEQFAYVASHDLQEPLRKIHMFADMAHKAVGDHNGAGKYLQKIESSAERMTRLIKDVLEYSRLSKIDESFIKVDLNIIVDYIRSDFELLIAEKNAVLTCGLLPVIKGQKLQLHQLFANLINNALKFNDGIPRIVISAESVSEKEIREMNLNVTKDYCKLLFADNGIGFDPRYKDQLFTIFQRLNSREKYEGTGIGLALCKKIVDNHRGFISVDSAPGKGTTFIVTLPCA
jgi:PAS domain S-box-containing protein